MPESLIYLILFAVVMLYMHRGKGGCGGPNHGHHKNDFSKHQHGSFKN